MVTGFADIKNRIISKLLQSEENDLSQTCASSRNKYPNINSTVLSIVYIIIFIIINIPNENIIIPINIFTI